MVYSVCETADRLTCQEHHLEVIHLKVLKALPQQVKQISGFCTLSWKMGQRKVEVTENASHHKYQYTACNWSLFLKKQKESRYITYTET